MRFVLLVCIIAAGALVGGCEKPPAPVAKKKHILPHTNRVARAVSPKPKPTKLVRMGTIDYLDAKNGFRDATFGQQETNFVNLVEISRDDSREVKVCARSDENLMLHEVPLERIEYRFYRGELYAVELQWKLTYPDNVITIPSTSTLGIHLSAEYGPPRKRRTNRNGIEYGWRGRRVEVLLTETLMPGVTDVAKGGWGLPPTTVGRMVIRNMTLSKAAENTLVQANRDSEGF